ncbi:envelope glycoprotein N [Beluga whale alphaherpesvirus 1]|uniref:Envelope glycoprotein N n=1 Tax=Beluga whale alphaherpesvirus 1 TaxID=1434720 RepID=A0A286RUG0_9ALPH|nr:envelope glycoprotein N [Beluga whale alphaherpesvirus 1]ASW27056.1 envelope glycoprotein N [Beluga whale alphaherpesvirus 1]
MVMGPGPAAGPSALVVLLSIILRAAPVRGSPSKVPLAELSGRSFWSADCYARGVEVSTPSTAFVLFCVALTIVLAVTIAYAYRICFRMIGADIKPDLARAVAGRS